MCIVIAEWSEERGEKKRERKKPDYQFEWKKNEIRGELFLFYPGCLSREKPGEVGLKLVLRRESLEN